MNTVKRIAVLGGGSIGTAIARGLVGSGQYRPEQITITRRKLDRLQALADRGFHVTGDNVEAVTSAALIFLTVDPLNLDGLIHEISPALDPSRHVIISIVSGVSIVEIISLIGKELPVVRAMPNTAIAIQESMTALAALPGSEHAIEIAKQIFDPLGKTLVMAEDQIVPATALCACGIAFFLRAIRAASQGGIEIGFHPDDSLLIASQTAKGAASLLLSHEKHPEQEIDKVTTPRGCTISGLNKMEHEGFSSSMIRGIVLSAEKAAQLYSRPAK
ncbi:MAG: pyrroline-5-carboxylate reductase [Candidatus Eisenbacteria bacterium]|uniref:Pyrroline-5-carboxylate reductase n=1 Tax=Eiseniibacteriota bacterium TaxID=2212470 RepID=A0A948RTE8_UNCEI|nr:pyrroline-5-carboxylate reductase [Candidatus Eisenbacteria bacterium]MBU1948153.1 pyrroline-5-carboxylate reductase [Candidatus Eisenbacteria bacterium]MBU2690680.1 pyrroline-5-carboxylate reductase [Candidatus Eisenbacteria bacterium]